MANLIVTPPREIGRNPIQTLTRWREEAPSLPNVETVNKRIAMVSLAKLWAGKFGAEKDVVVRAAAAMGQEAVDETITKVRDEFKAKVNDARLWDIFENGTSEQWQAVQDESWREIFLQYAEGDLKRLEQLEKESPGEFIALVLRDSQDDKGRPVLISTTPSELNAVLQASGKFEVESDKAKARVLMVDQHFTYMGLLRATRRNGELLFEFPCSSPDTIGWHFLEGVTRQIKKLLHADTGKESQLL